MTKNGIFQMSLKGFYMDKTKNEIITFKADASLLEAMKGIPNRSEFIRNAILSSLDGVCPLCKGTGILTPHQKIHMDSFLTDHLLEECHECNELHLICPNRQHEAIGERGHIVEKKMLGDQQVCSSGDKG